MTRSTWQGCYDDGWKGIITDAAFRHPAKFSRSLITRIIEHCLERGYLKPGDVVADPFAGVACGGIVAASYGLVWRGMELEDQFVKLAGGFDCPGMSKAEWVRWYGRGKRNSLVCLDCQDLKGEAAYVKNSGQIPSPAPHRYKGNFDLHRHTWEAMGDPVPVIVQGDSQTQFAEFCGQATVALSSPPYAECISAASSDGIDWSKCSDGKGGIRDFSKEPGQATRVHMGVRYGTTPGQIGAMKSGDVQSVISSPPYVSGGHHPDQTGSWGGQAQSVDRDVAGYGCTEGQIGQMRAGDVNAVVSSPPYEESVSAKSHGIDFTKAKEGGKRRTNGRDAYGCSYGSTAGQIGQMRAGDVGAVVSSPPYEASQVASETDMRKQARLAARAAGAWEGYNRANPDNIGNESGDSYWHAVRDVYQQCHMALKPGGYIIVVVKAFVRKRKLVDLPGQTLELLTSLGFTPVEYIKAMLTKEERHASLFGGEHVVKTEKKSFFRKLCEKKGSPPIDFEVVLIARR